MPKNVLEEMNDGHFSERGKKALIFGAIFGLAEYVLKDDIKLQGLFPAYCVEPGKILDKVLIPVNSKRRPPRIERRLNELVDQLQTEDLSLKFDNKESGVVLLASHWERSYLTK